MKTISSEIIRYANIKKPNKVLTESEADNDIQVFMNTWANYNEYGADEGITPTGWMSPEEGLEYCKKYADKEPFINDTDNCPIEVSEYDNASAKLEQLIKLNSLGNKEIILAILEATGDDDVDNAIEIEESGDYIWFPGVDNEYDLGKAYVDMCGDIKSAISKDRLDNYIDRDKYKESIENGLSEEDLEEMDIDGYVEELISNDISDGNIDEYYFDYEAYGRDLSYEYTFVDGGAISVL